MNRLVKFRVWDKNNNKMIPSSDVSWVEASIGGKFINLLTVSFLDGVNKGFIPLQFTGLFDKNNKEIYEGDIVELQYWPEDVQNSNIKTDKIGVIEFNTQYSCYYCVGKTEDGLVTHATLYSKPGENKLKIIGNIFETPDLIK